MRREWRGAAERDGVETNQNHITGDGDGCHRTACDVACCDWLREGGGAVARWWGERSPARSVVLSALSCAAAICVGVVLV